MPPQQSQFLNEESPNLFAGRGPCLQFENKTNKTRSIFQNPRAIKWGEPVLEFPDLKELIVLWPILSPSQLTEGPWH